MENSCMKSPSVAPVPACALDRALRNRELKPSGQEFPLDSDWQKPKDIRKFARCRRAVTGMAAML
jgi:hypothetical protein